MRRFSSKYNRSERAKQVRVLVPALDQPDVRLKLFERLRLEPPMTKAESKDIDAWHFVWPLRDLFYFDREVARASGNWKELRSNWVSYLGLPSWAEDGGWWRHPFTDDRDFVVHPCNRDIGWVAKAIRKRADRFSLKHDVEHAIEVLEATRRVMNTECDCLIQTPLRLIVVECKDKTGFSNEQAERQAGLRDALEKAFPRRNAPLYVEVSNIERDRRTPNAWTWDEIAELLG